MPNNYIIKSLTTTIGIILASFFIYWSFKNIELALVSQAIKESNFALAIPILAFEIGYLYIKTIKWKLLLGPSSTLSTAQLFSPVLIGYGGNLLVPHIGEIYRAMHINRAQNLEISTVLTTIFIERLFDILALLFFALILFFSIYETSESYLNAIIIISVIAILAISLIFIFLLFNDLITNIILKIIKPISMRFHDFAESNLASINSCLKHTIKIKNIFLTMLYSVLQWGCMTACIYYSLVAVGLSPTFYAPMLILITLVAGMTLPTAPGNIGTIQIAFVIACSIFSYSPEKVLSASIIYNVLTTIPFFILALILFNNNAGNKKV